jgi:DNA-binding HxlR family transcriptional regulator
MTAHNSSKGLGRTQILVLNLLAAGGPKSARDLERDWPSMTPDKAYSALASLGNRGLVDAAGFDGRARTYCLTAKGAAVERKLLEEVLCTITTS